MKKIQAILILIILFLNGYSQYELTEQAKTGQSIGNLIGKLLGYALIFGIMYLIYRSFTKKTK